MPLINDFSNGQTNAVCAARLIICCSRSGIVQIVIPISLSIIDSITKLRMEKQSGLTLLNEGF